MSTENIWKGEVDFLVSLFSNFDCVHIRKPQCSSKELKNLMEQIPNEFHTKMVNHGHLDLWNDFNWKSAHFSAKNPVPNNWQFPYSFSCHSFEEIQQHTTCSYVFLSPVFDSISKQDYKSAFTNKAHLQQELKAIKLLGYSSKIIALGGINQENEQIALDLGFDGVCYKGALMTSHA